MSNHNFSRLNFFPNGEESSLSAHEISNLMSHKEIKVKYGVLGIIQDITADM